MNKTAARLAFVLALVCARGLRAHDLWIEPSAFQPAPGTRLAVRLFIGQLFRGDVFPRDPKYLVRFAVLGNGGETPTPGLPDTDPAGFLVGGRRGQSGAPGKEIYSRCAKSLIAIGGDAGSGHDRVLGLTLELIPEANPYTLAAGQELPVRLLYGGQPLAGAKVAAGAKGRAARPGGARHRAP